MEADENASEMVSRAMGLANDAVEADNRGDAASAVRLYQESVDLISYGLSLHDEEAVDAEPIDTAQLLEFSQAYSDRVAELTGGAGCSGSVASSHTFSKKKTSSTQLDCAV